MAPFILQESATTTVTLTSLLGVYIALGGTLVAAGLAAFASFRASNKASATAKEVAELSTRTAQDLKELDYKYDFYKKIIAKRLGAWEEAENFIASISKILIDKKDEKNFYEFCSNGKNLTDFIDKANSIILSQTTWLGKEYGKEFMNLLNFNIELLRASMSSDGNRITRVNDIVVMSYGKANCETHTKILNKLLLTLSRQVDSMHNVEPFFEELKSTRLHLGG